MIERKLSKFEIGAIVSKPMDQAELDGLAFHIQERQQAVVDFFTDLRSNDNNLTDRGWAKEQEDPKFPKEFWAFSYDVDQDSQVHSVILDQSFEVFLSLYGIEAESPYKINILFDKKQNLEKFVVDIVQFHATGTGKYGAFAITGRKDDGFTWDDQDKKRKKFTNETDKLLIFEEIIEVIRATKN